MTLPQKLGSKPRGFASLADPSLNRWWVIMQTNLKLRNGQNLTLILTKFVDSSLKGWGVITQTSLLTHEQTERQTDWHTGNYNTRRPKLASGNKNGLVTAKLGQSVMTVLLLLPCRYRSHQSWRLWVQSHWLESVCGGWAESTRGMGSQHWQSHHILTAGSGCKTLCLHRPYIAPTDNYPASMQHK